jgi:hypothetical protein
MRLEYLRPGAAMMWTVPAANRSRQIRIVVEETPDRSWDWTVWETGRTGTSKFGVRATAAKALADAVAAATELGSSSSRDDAAGADPEPDGVAIFAKVETAADGVRLCVGGVCVHHWTDAEHQRDAEKMAAEINAVFLMSHRSPTDP